MTVNCEKVHAMLDFVEIALTALPCFAYRLWFDIKGAPDPTQETVLHVDKPMNDTLSYGSSFAFKECWHVFSSKTRHPYNEEPITTKSSC